MPTQKVACAAFRFWLGAQTNKGGRGHAQMLLPSLEIGAAQLLSVTEIAPKSPLLCVNRNPIRYGFRAGAKAIAIQSRSLVPWGLHRKL